MMIEKDEKTTIISKIVEYIQFDENFSLYKITTKINDIGSYKFGICLNEEIENLKRSPDYFSSKVDGFKIFNKRIVEALRTNSEDLKNRIKEFSFSVPEMLNIAKDLPDFEDYIILRVDEDRFEFSEYNSKYCLPKSIQFEYPDITSEKYNLDVILYKLKQRNDLEILENETGNLLHKRNNIEFIRCVWQPSKYNWNIVYQEKEKHFGLKVKDFIKEKIFEV